MNKLYLIEIYESNYRNSETTIEQLSIVKSYSQQEFLSISIISPSDTETVKELLEDYYDS